MMRIACRMPRKSRITRRGFHQDIGLFWVQVRKRNGTVLHMMDNGTVQPTRWYSNWKKLVILFSQPPVHFETKERQMYHSLQWRFHEHRTIISNSSFCESSQCLRGCYELVLQSCFEEGGKEHIPAPVDNRILAIVERAEVEMLISSPILLDDAEWGKIQSTGKGGPHDPIMWKSLFHILWSPRISTKFDQTQKTDGEKLLLCAEKIRVLDLIRKPNLWQLFPKAPLLDQFWHFILWKFLTDMEQKFRFHRSQIQRTHLTLWYPERKSVLWMKFMITNKSSDPAMHCSQTFKNQENMKNER